MHVNDWRRLRAIGPVLGTVILVLAACASPSAASPTPEPTDAPTEAADTPSPEPSESDGGGTGEPGVEGPAEVEAGVQFDVAWTGPDNRGDYIALVPAGTAEWTNADPWFYTANGNPGSFVAPSADGEYELWYVNGADDAVLARADITVLPFTGDLLGPEEVVAGSEFEVAWNGPDGPGDYVTIVPKGAEQWTGADDYFYTSEGSPGTLTAPIGAGDYHLWYVTADGVIQSRRDIVVVPLVVTLEAPDSVAAGDTFEVEWTGPDGNGDYITIVPAGSEEGAYLDYAYTNEGNPVTLTAPDERGDYEIWYASDRVRGTFESITITVT